ncbi:unnamed protein product [Diatraea saccharalis]|uniref:Uncharacterized protein n=1 Tax=Diatraea saccharalis TaxID=40085 RepID=A0A9N9RDS8_9NEOP|nr:unnamed protein product [Diatraea saccharalis]
MDTGSESFRSQDTPNSVLSSDFDDNPDQNVLRLQNPENDVLRLTEPEANHNVKTNVLKLKQEWNDSLVLKMSNLNLNPVENRPKNLGISPPRHSSTLTLTTNHPLMGLGSPEENYPDLIPKKLHKIEDDKDFSLSSIEDERHSETNGFYSPQRNTSKNNLYFTENFVTAESQILTESKLDSQSLSRLSEKTERRVVVSRINDLKIDMTPPRLTRVNNGKEDSAIREFMERNKLTSQSQSTPKSSRNVDIPESEEFHSGVSIKKKYIKR